MDTVRVTPPWEKQPHCSEADLKKKKRRQKESPASTVRGGLKAVYRVN